jgi:hypothetical protein
MPAGALLVGSLVAWRVVRRSHSDTVWLPLEFMDGLSYTTIIEFAEPLARRRGSALER